MLTGREDCLEDQELLYLRRYQVHLPPLDNYFFPFKSFLDVIRRPLSPTHFKDVLFPPMKFISFAAS